MKTPARAREAKARAALALTWDGSRRATGALPAAARAFLKTGGGKTPGRASLAKLLAGDAIRELRICWVPRLQGGDDTLADPFTTRDGRRIGFRAVAWRRFGDVCGVIYRRSPPGS